MFACLTVSLHSARLRARQKERIAQRTSEASSFIDRIELPTQSLIQSVNIMKDLDKEKIDDKHEQVSAINLENKILSQELDEKRCGFPARIRKLSKYGYKRFHSDHLDLSVRSPGNLSSEIFLPIDQLENKANASSVPSSNLLPVLGLCAPNANQVNLSTRNSRTPLRIPSSDKRISSRNAEYQLPPACDPRSSNDLNDEGRERSASTCLLPEASRESMHHKLKNLVPEGYFPFCPVCTCIIFVSMLFPWLLLIFEV